MSNSRGGKPPRVSFEKRWIEKKGKVIFAGREMFVGKEPIGVIKPKDGAGKFISTPHEAYGAKAIQWDTWEEAVDHLLLCWKQGVVNPRVRAVRNPQKWNEKGLHGWNGS